MVSNQMRENKSDWLTAYQEVDTEYLEILPQKEAQVNDSDTQL